MAVDHVVAKADRAVVVGRRRDGPGAVAVVGDAAVIGDEVGDRDRVAIHVAEAGEQGRGADHVLRVLSAGSQRGGGRARGRVVDRGEAETLRGGDAAAVSVGDVVVQRDRAVVV